MLCICLVHNIQLTSLLWVRPSDTALNWLGLEKIESRTCRRLTFIEIAVNEKGEFFGPR